MKPITCHKCGIVVAKLATGSLLKHGTVAICAECEKLLQLSKNRVEPPEFLKKVFGL